MSEAARARKRKYYAAHKAKLAADKRARYAADKDKINTRKRSRRRANKEQLAAKEKAYMAANPVQGAAARLRQSAQQARKYGHVPVALTVEEVLEKLRAEHCEICGKHLMSPQRHLDHDHKTGKFRGILCARCNLLVGKLESPLLAKAQAYLERTST